jgi:GxxExxY protein
LQRISGDDDQRNSTPRRVAGGRLARPSASSQRARDPLPIVYRGARLDAGYRLDLLVEGTVVLELKAVEELAPIHKAQLISYLKLGGFPSGLLINFNVVHLRDGIKRVYPRAARDDEE